ncbi:short-chain dehydrogenase/reductase SDR [Hyaloraphidium curvatum]|nr:short-chain dehydrogenase/reductase SDR [Hyaloraphidium curvatum]
MSGLRLAHRPVAFVTGAAAPKGMGRASALLLAKHGARVVVSDLPSKEAQGKEVAEAIGKGGGEAIWVPLDVSDEEGWRAAVDSAEKQLGPLSVLVNNAGIGFPEIDGPPQTLADHPTAAWRRVLGVNLDGVYFGLKHGAKSMLKRADKSHQGSIINFSSVAGLSGTGVPYGMLGYTVSKWGVRGLTKQAAAHFAPLGIKVNGIHPGPIATNIFDEMIEKQPGLGEALAQTGGSTVPAGRWGRPEDVANAVLFLAGDESSYMYGAELVVDGGFMTANGLHTVGV